ncbi:MAG: 4-phosphoerythronate dehydrogenase [Tannerellaceae bacterium]|jgi:erythronate-4-phosphate dehydrogenase|nr:4-phosphoerythronate dehydrogenase [Tannerellaceae bacterium]
MWIGVERTIPYIYGVLEGLGVEVRYFGAAELAGGGVKGVEVLVIRSINKCGRKELEGSGVKLVVTASVGEDHIDKEYCAGAGIGWRNAAGSNARSVGEYVLGSLMELEVRGGAGMWSGKTVGIVGVGHVGKEVSKLSKAIGMEVLLNDPPRAAAEGGAGFVELEEIARSADVITFHTPLTEGGRWGTKHLLNGRLVELLERKPYVINASRGGVCEPAALIRGRREGKIGGLVIDCWEGEPGISEELLGVADIGTPHIAGFSVEGKVNAVKSCVEWVGEYAGVGEEKRRAALGRVEVPASREEEIDMEEFKDKRIARAVLRVNSLGAIDKRLRSGVRSFEELRRTYSHPREIGGYRVVHAGAGEGEVLRRLGFRVE